MMCFYRVCTFRGACFHLTLNTHLEGACPFSWRHIVWCHIVWWRRMRLRRQTLTPIRLDDIFSRRSTMLPSTRCIFEGAYLVSDWNILPQVRSFCFSGRVLLMGLASAHYVWLAVNRKESYRVKHSQSAAPATKFARGRQRRKSQWHSCKQRRTRRFAKSRALDGCCALVQHGRSKVLKMHPIQGAFLCEPPLSQAGC